MPPLRAFLAAAVVLAVGTPSAAAAAAARKPTFTIKRAAASLGAAEGPRSPIGLPLPTPQQLAWQQGEIMALIHFNMATFFQNGDPGCTPQNWPGPTGSSNPASFAPTNLNISQWADLMVDLGINEAVITAKHGCGFLLWPTQVKLPAGTPYTYHVDETLYGSVFTEFAATMKANGIGHGAYYSLTNNWFLNALDHEVQPGPLLPGQVNVTQQQYEDISVALLTELWCNGTMNGGNFTEIWFDGGYGDLAPRLLPLLQQCQPNVVAFGGDNLIASSVRWCGTESGNPPGLPEIYSTYCEDGPVNGCPANSTGAKWLSSGVDVTLQAYDTWFFEPGNPVHSLSDLVTFYQNSVGHNGKLELDFAVSRTGELAPTHVAAYRGLAAWIRSCYSSPVARGTPAVGATTYTLSFPLTAIDRVMLQEDQSFGELVYAFEITYQAADGTWQPFSTGRVVGNKRIDVLPSPVNATGVRVVLTATLDTPHLSNVAAFAAAPCVIPQTKVKFTFGSSCLISNATFPCPGGAGNSCPVFLGSCDDPSALWDDDQGVLANLHYAGSQINIDCNYVAPHTVAKLLAAGGSSIAYSSQSGGQLVYTYGSSVMCLNNGSGPVTPPCNSNEPYATDQITLEDCSSPSTQGWGRVVQA